MRNHHQRRSAQCHDPQYLVAATALAKARYALNTNDAGPFILKRFSHHARRRKVCYLQLAGCEFTQRQTSEFRDEFDGVWGVIKVWLSRFYVGTSTGAVFCTRPEKELRALIRKIATEKK
ncbi:MAG TPA: hypothetical protein VI585_11830 [Candidatus Binatia bacterium]